MDMWMRSEGVVVEVVSPSKKIERFESSKFVLNDSYVELVSVAIPPPFQREHALVTRLRASSAGRGEIWRESVPT